MNKRTSSIVVGGCSALALAAGIGWLLRPMSCEQAAVAALTATESVNGRQLFALTPPEERALYNLTPEKVQALLDASGYGKNIVPDGKILEQANSNDGSVTVSRWYKIGGKARGVSGITAEMRRRHEVFVQSPITTLIYMTIYASGLQDVDGPKPLVYVKGLARCKSVLANLGFTGVADAEGSHIIPWTEIESQFETRLQHYESLHTAHLQNDEATAARQ